MSLQLWKRFCDHYFWNAEVGFGLDISRVRFPDDFIASMTAPMKTALDAMTALEAGAIANRDENRMVGHYWLRAPELAPTPELRSTIEKTLASIREFTAGVHGGQIRGKGGPFENLLVVGIGGSCLGPQFVARAFAARDNPIKPHFLDNTDPDGIERALWAVRDTLDRTIVIVISKSGGTPETRNGMILARNAYVEADLDFGQHAVAITQVGSVLDNVAVHEGWLARFPMWDWVGGRTSETSAVGLLPAALQGIKINELLAGAAAMDRLTRQQVIRANPAALLALAWHHIGGGRGEKDMVVLPYKDRLELFSRYLQQLVMESLGKKLDRQGNTVHQGIAVYGNKGSTDQHAYVQQLRDGLDNFFVTFIEVLADGGSQAEVDSQVTAGDYLSGFLQGTRQALFDGGRESITLTIEDVTPFSVGALIALFERAVGLYAELIDVNAYHQPGVEAGKKAAASVLDVQKAVLAHYKANPSPKTADQIALAIGRPEDTQTVFHILRHLAANTGRGIRANEAASPEQIMFGRE